MDSDRWPAFITGFVLGVLVTIGVVGVYGWQKLNVERERALAVEMMAREERDRAMESELRARQAQQAAEEARKQQEDLLKKLNDQKRQGKEKEDK